MPVVNVAAEDIAIQFVKLSAETCRVAVPQVVDVGAEIVETFMASLNVTLIVAFSAAPVALFAGAVEVTVGGVVSAPLEPPEPDESEDAPLCALSELLHDKPKLTARRNGIKGRSIEAEASVPSSCGR